jgi:hypothetical protein
MLVCESLIGLTVSAGIGRRYTGETAYPIVVDRVVSIRYEAACPRRLDLLGAGGRRSFDWSLRGERDG